MSNIYAVLASLVYRLAPVSSRFYNAGLIASFSVRQLNVKTA
ncbi:uncharacterized protein METZ01_LOCUS57343 [marine metagenome]|uniref:Uncharacterized protein n=1 Tax=marine metagenome TaxID=408172 RepID=A0A381SM20_9ZZZZ